MFNDDIKNAFAKALREVPVQVEIRGRRISLVEMLNDITHLMDIDSDPAVDDQSFWDAFDGLKEKYSMDGGDSTSVKDGFFKPDEEYEYFPLQELLVGLLAVEPFDSASVYFGEDDEGAYFRVYVPDDVTSIDPREYAPQ